jgi:hypothetical protein
MCWAVSSSSSSSSYSHRSEPDISSHQRLTEIVKSSTFGNNDRRISKVLRVGEISCNSRVVIDAQGNFAKDRRMVCSLRAVSWQE